MTCLSFCTFSFVHCVVCSSSIYGFWLPLCYLQTFLAWSKYKYTCFIYIGILENCWAGWKGFRKSCYKIFINSNLNKEQAEDQCVKYGGHLVSISSKEEMQFVHGLIIYKMQNMTDAIFIGMLVYQEFKIQSNLVMRPSLLKCHLFLVPS